MKKENSKFKIQNLKRQVKTQKFRLNTLLDTERLAQRIVKRLRGGEVLALTGPLGAGKTTFVQYLAKAMGITKNVRSPSFVVLQTFEVKPKARSSKLEARTLCHVDAYRLKDANELEALGLYDYLGQPDVITVIEWAEKMKKVLPRHATWLIFKFTKNIHTVSVKG